MPSRSTSLVFLVTRGDWEGQSGGGNHDIHGTTARTAALGSQASAQQAVVVGGVVSEGDAVTVDGLDQCQPVLTT